MIEWAVHISDAQAVTSPDRLLELPAAEDGLTPVHALTLRLIEQYVGAVRVSRIYFGNEFCQQLIPSLAALKRVYSAAVDQGVSLTLLTPYVNDEGLKKLTPLLAFLDAQAEPSEVVFNDWGVLQHLKAFPRLRPVQGRLLDKMLRDPRIAGFYRTAPEPIRAAFQRSNATAPLYADFLRAHGIEWVELDNVPQGLDVDFRPLPIGAAVYVPYGVVATGRVCMIASLHQLKRERFRPDVKCRHECQQYLTIYTYTSSPLGNKDQRFYLKGNTHFYAHTEEMLRFILTQAESLGIRRLIYQPGLPMWLA